MGSYDPSEAETGHGRGGDARGIAETAYVRPTTILDAPAPRGEHRADAGHNGRRIRDATQESYG